MDDGDSYYRYYNAVVLGNEDVAYLYYDGIYYDLRGEYLEPGTVLLWFKREAGKLVTYWGEILVWYDFGTYGEYFHMTQETPVIRWKW